MPISEYLRRQADACLRIARGGFDLGTAERLGALAAELRAKADELEDEQDDERAFRPHMQPGNGRNGSSGSSRNGSEGGF